MQHRVYYQPYIEESHKDLCKIYWQRNTDKKASFTYSVPEIAEKFNISNKEIPQLIRSGSYLLLDGYFCLGCNIQRIVRTRSELRQQTKEWRCEKCAFSWSNSYNADRQVREVLEKQNRTGLSEMSDMIINRLNHLNARKTPEPGKLNIVDKYLLVIVLDVLANNNTKNIVKLINNSCILTDEKRLSPSLALDIQILKRLHTKNLLTINYQESYRPFYINEKGDLEIDYKYADFNFSYNNEQLRVLTTFLKTEDAKCELINHPEFSKWAENIIVHELIEYLLIESAYESLYPNIGANILTVLKELAINYSLNNCYYAVWSAVQYSAKFYRKGANKKHAANTIGKNIETNLEKLKATPYNGKLFQRPKELPQSLLSKRMLDDNFGIKDCSFKLPLKFLLENCIAHINYNSIDSNVALSASSANTAVNNLNISNINILNYQKHSIYGKLGSK